MFKTFRVPALSNDWSVSTMFGAALYLSKACVQTGAGRVLTNVSRLNMIRPVIVSGVDGETQRSRSTRGGHICHHRFVFPCMVAGTG
jgi:hypothetical protein